MKKFISLFLVISMIMCNLNTGVVEALSSYGNEIKSSINTLTKNKEAKIVDTKEDRGLEKETTQVAINNYADNTEVVGSQNKEKKEEKSLNKKLSTDNKVKMQKNVILFYDIGTETFYYINSENKPQELSLMNENVARNKDKINLNNILTYANSDNVNNILDAQEVTLVITGTGSNIDFWLDNESIDVPFNIIFYKMKGTHCSFLLENVKSIRVNDENTIENSVDDDIALTYSFDGSDLSPLTIDDSSSFIVYNEEKDNISSNIVYSGDSGNDSENSGNDSENSGYSSIVNISFEEENIPNGKKFILDPAVNNNGSQKKFSTKAGYNALSMLLVSDENNYFLKEENNQTPYYYRESSSIESNQIQGRVKTKLTLGNNITNNCYEVSNKARVEVVATQNAITNCYLVDGLDEAMNNFVNLNGATHEVIFLGDYSVKTEDVEAIKSYSNDTDGITFKTEVDDYKYSLNIGIDIEFMINNGNKFTITFDDIKFKYTSSNNWIYANNRQLKFGNDVEMEGTNYPSISLGGKNDLPADFKTVSDGYLIINSGTYNFVTGDCYSTLQNVDITIYGGTFKGGVSGVSNNSQNNNATNNVTLTINNGIFECKVYGIGTTSNINKDLNMTIKGGTFYNDVIAVAGKVGNNAKLDISNNATLFRSSVLGASNGSNIVGYLDVSINGGTFRGNVIGICGGIADSTKLTINNATFYKSLIGASANTNTEKFTFQGLLSRYLFNNIRITNKKVQVPSSVLNGVNINLDIKGGTFKDVVIGTNIANTTLKMTVSGGKFAKSLIGNTQSNDQIDNTTINIDKSITIPIISEFSRLVVGGNKKGIVLKVNQLDKGHSIGNLYLNNGSKISFTSSKDTSKLKNIILDGADNTLSLLPKNRTKNTVLLELSGEIENNGNKLNIEFSKNNSTIDEIYLIKFTTLGKEDVTGKYNPPKGYYVRDKQEDGSGYVILCPQITSDLKYDLEHDKLYIMNDKGQSEAWWYTGKVNNDITLNTVDLYTYKGYDLFEDSKNKDRNIILTGTNSDKNIIVNNDLYNINVKLDNIDLTNSRITLNNLNHLTISGINVINSINEAQNIFTYTFNNKQVDDKVLFDDNNSYLKICTKEDINPFNAYQEDCMDFKFLDPFTSQNVVRLKDDTGRKFIFDIPSGTQRLGVLLKDTKDNTTYNLYHGPSGEEGNSVYVSGETEETFKDTFNTLLNNGQAYEYVRRAKPFKSINVEIPNPINFSVDTTSSGYYRITPENWNKYFKATDIKIENNSIIIKDQFTYNGETKDLGKKNLDLELGYLGVSPSQNSKNDIELISKSKLDSNIITSNISGVKLALNLDGISIDESEVKTTPSKTWTIPSKSTTTLKVVPDFDSNKHFFNVNPEAPAKLNSSHRFIFRVGFKES